MLPNSGSNGLRTGKNTDFGTELVFHGIDNPDFPNEWRPLGLE